MQWDPRSKLGPALSRIKDRTITSLASIIYLNKSLLWLSKWRKHRDGEEGDDGDSRKIKSGK